MSAKDYISKWLEALEYLPRFKRAPSYWELSDEFNELGFGRDEFYLAIDSIGAELESQGYRLIWEAPYDGAPRWVILEKEEV